MMMVMMQIARGHYWLRLGVYDDDEDADADDADTDAGADDTAMVLMMLMSTSYYTAIKKGPFTHADGERRDGWHTWSSKRT